MDFISALSGTDITLITSTTLLIALTCMYGIFLNYSKNAMADTENTIFKIFNIMVTFAIWTIVYAIVMLTLIFVIMNMTMCKYQPTIDVDNLSISNPVYLNNSTNLTNLISSSSFTSPINNTTFNYTEITDLQEMLIEPEIDILTEVETYTKPKRLRGKRTNKRKGKN